MIGFIYVYPILVALLSFIFLKETLPQYGYVGVAFIIIGVLLLSIRIKQVHLDTCIWFIIAIVLLTAVDEFFVKITTTHLSASQGFAANGIALGIALSAGLIFPSVRKKFCKEIHNLKFAGLSEIFTASALLTLYLAMAELPATIVSSIAAIQPMAVLFFERITNRFVGKITKDNLLLPKTGAMILIVVGVALLYLSV